LLCSENKANLWIDLAIKFSSDVLVSEFRAFFNII